MIQRIQTIWLLLASLCGFASLKFPFFISSIALAPAVDLTAMSNTLLMIVTVAAAIVALITIFLYGNRKLQIKLGSAGSIASILAIILYFVEMKNYSSGGVALFSVFSFAVPVFYILALRGIYKDEKLVRSSDRLR